MYLWPLLMAFSELILFECVSKNQTTIVIHPTLPSSKCLLPCNQCDYKIPEQGNLTKHKLNKHEDVNYACNQCTYEATTKGRLKHHQKEHT